MSSDKTDDLTARRPQRFRLSLEDRSALKASLFGAGNKARHKVRFWLLTILSVVIAVMGLTAGSTAVVIGAMLIAPLMAPILATSAGITMGSVRLSMRSGLQVVLASVAGFAIAVGLSALIPGDNLTDEVLLRTAPDLRDLVVAIAAGIAGAYATARQDSSAALPGVAVAVALIPPLAAIGVTFEAGRYDLAEGATLLYLTNLLAIAASGVVVFLVLGLGPRNLTAMRKLWTQTGLLTSLIVVVAIGSLLLNQSQRIASRNDRQQTALEEIQKWIGPQLDLEIDDVRLQDMLIAIDLVGSDEPPALDPLVSSLNTAIGESEVRVRWLQRTSSSSSEVPDESTIRRTAVEAIAAEWIGSDSRDEIRSTTITETDVILEITGPDTPPPSARLVDLLAEAGMELGVEVRWTQQRELDDTELKVQERESEIKQLSQTWASEIDPTLEVTNVIIDGTDAEIYLAGALQELDTQRLVAQLQSEIDDELEFTFFLSIRVSIG